MHTLKTFFFLLLLQIGLIAQVLSIDTISSHIENTLQTCLKGKNKNIVHHIYTQTDYRPVWIGQENQEKMSQLIDALKDPLFNYKNKSFDQKAIRQLFFQLDNGDITPSKKAAVYARLDVMLSNSFVRLVRFIVQGDVDWNLVQKKLKDLKTSDDITARWEMVPRSFPNANKVASAAINGNIREY
ncbi:MAG TPA: murein L,D-transpeptidase, partial [Epsilonproteobacteria bacterium]|nr:murein L,D-transpeptidase [Campylobacterota bacterium]